ncbi:MAG TPA: antitoxin family protein [Terriglobia bacterium]|nr:antitoxin family protein [Terriglobia bacterium]
MTKVIEAIFDGVTFRPEEAPDLPPNTRVRLTIESPQTPDTPGSFLRTARALALSGPRDWSANVEDYLHGRKTHPEQ